MYAERFTFFLFYFTKWVRLSSRCSLFFYFLLLPLFFFWAEPCEDDHERKASGAFVRVRVRVARVVEARLAGVVAELGMMGVQDPNKDLDILLLSFLPFVASSPFIFLGSLGLYSLATGYFCCLFWAPAISALLSIIQRQPTASFVLFLFFFLTSKGKKNLSSQQVHDYPATERKNCKKKNKPQRTFF